RRSSLLWTGATAARARPRLDRRGRQGRPPPRPGCDGACRVPPAGWFEVRRAGRATIAPADAMPVLRLTGRRDERPADKMLAPSLSDRETFASSRAPARRLGWRRGMAMRNSLRVGPRFPQVVVLVGATGDLSRRKLIP